MKILISVGVLLIFLGVLAGGKLSQSSQTPVTEQTKIIEGASPSSFVSASPQPSEETQLPFQELTVPYLRNRVYQSTLSSLEKVSETAVYTSYITSYTSDGFKVNGLLTQPKGQMPEGGWPAIVFIHGYIPPAQYRTQGPQYSAYVDALAKNGFVVFKIDLRGHGSSEGKAMGAYYSSEYVVDTLNAYSVLEQQPFVNKEKIGLWGHSMAGNVSLRAAVVKPKIPAVVIWAGAVFSYQDFLEYGISDGSYQPPSSDSERQRLRQLLRQTHGEFDQSNAFWKQVAPTNYLQDFEGKIQLHHAMNDVVVDIRYSRNLRDILAEMGKEHELHEYSSGGHNLNGASFNTAMQRTIEFYKKHL